MVYETTTVFSLTIVTKHSARCSLNWYALPAFVILLVHNDFIITVSQFYILISYLMIVNYMYTHPLCCILYFVVSVTCKMLWLPDIYI